MRASRGWSTPSPSLRTDKAYSDADLQGSSSDSEDEVMGQYQEAVSRSQGLRGAAKMVANIKHAAGFTWESRHKYSPLSADYDGYSSEASADDGRFCTTPLPNQRTPPPSPTPSCFTARQSHPDGSSPCFLEHPQSALIVPQEVALADFILYADILPPTSPPRLFITAVSRSQKYRLFCTSNPIPQITHTHWHTLSVNPQRWSKRSSLSAHSPWECCETVNCLHNLHSPTLLFFPSSSFLFFLFCFFFFLGCISVSHLAESPSQGVYPGGWKARRASFGFNFNGPSRRRTPALTYLDRCDIYPSRRRTETRAVGLLNSQKKKRAPWMWILFNIQLIYHQFLFNNLDDLSVQEQWVSPPKNLLNKGDRISLLCLQVPEMEGQLSFSNLLC